MDQPKCGIVTGGASGIGLATVRRLAAEGYNVVSIDLQPSPVAGEPGAANGGNVVCLVGSVVDPASAKACLEAISERGWPLDFLINVAGISPPFFPLHETSSEIFSKTQAVNLTGTFNMYRAVAQAMIAAGRRGSIVNIASIAGFRPVPQAGAYCASKFGVIGLTQTAALEVAKYGIRVNAVCPGATDTPILAASLGGGPTEQLTANIPMGEVASPTMIAGAIAWLVSDAASYVTGVSLPVDGGLSLI